MGIPRWTQDLTAYLEAGVVTTTPDNESRLVLRNIVIDGPSLVFHVYNALALSSHATASSSLNEPTYAQLNSAIDVLLVDLESCGANIEWIYFDGALPLSKRATRIDRLEKSRIQLERLKVLGPPPRPLALSRDTHRDQISTLLWQTKSSSSGTSSFISPFIVPSVIEHLLHSKWKNIVSVVNGEAETSCASTAKATRATVLSNDSDFTLLADMQDGQIVGLLRSMNMHVSPDGSSSTIAIQCWRPQHIATRLVVQSLLHVGFQRSKDPTASFATVMQRAQSEASQQNAASIEFDRFSDQYKACVAPRATIGRSCDLNLNQLDPRLAEFACQLMDDASSATAQTDELWVTLPILLEDSSKDASWTYGRSMRQLAYSLLYSNYGTTTKSTCTMTEWSRKGARVTHDIVETVPLAKLSHGIRGCVADLVSLPRFNSSSNHLGDEDLRDFVLWALGSVLKQRATAGKNVMPSVTIREYLGFGNPSSRSFLAGKRAGSSDHDREWSLVHLNANIHSLLYSLRMLHQICALLSGTVTTMACKDEFVKLLELVRFMPTMEDLFLDTGKVRSLMQKSPLSKSDRAFNEIYPYSGQSLDMLLPQKAGTNSTTTPVMTKVVHKRKKKRRLADASLDNQHKQTESQKRVGTNPFDVLMEAD